MPVTAIAAKPTAGLKIWATLVTGRFRTALEIDGSYVENYRMAGVGR